MDKGYDTIWAELAAKIPWHTTDEELKKRDKIWTSMDTNGNGLITLDELEAGVKKLGLPALFELKPVLQRAFNAAKNKLKAKKKKSYNEDDFVSRGEFRLLLKYLRKYYELWVAFDRIDTGDDRRISHDEFITAKPMLEKWGIDMSDPEKQWREADRDGGGQIVFDEFCEWGIKKQLDLDDDDDDDGDLKPKA